MLGEVLTFFIIKLYKNCKRFFNKKLFNFLSVVAETTGSLSGVSITSELNEELNDLIQRFHNQLRDGQVMHFFLKVFFF